MSIELVKAEIARFLASPTPEALCVRGRWGVGKTYTWRAYLKAAVDNKALAAERYAYVSLFGLNSLEELKYATFENSVPRASIEAGPTLESFDNALAAAERGGRHLARYIQKVPVIGQWASAATPALFLAVRKQLVCIDDLERRGKGLDAGDILGFASFLKEERRCKVVLLLNEEELDEDARKKFDKYLEKVIDRSLVFDPSPAEAAQIAFAEGGPMAEKLKANCTTLGISNIRVMYKIAGFTKEIEPLLVEFDERIQNQAAHTITLLAWSHFQPGSAPSTDYIAQQRGHGLYGLNREEPTPEQAAWNALLDSYEFGSLDEFDQVILDGIMQGFFDPKKVRQAAEAMDKNLRAAGSMAEFDAAWRLYHDSLDDNADAVAAAIHGSFLKNFRGITPVNLDGSVRLLKDLGRADLAEEIIAAYMERDEPREFFDLHSYTFNDDVTDPDVIAAFDAKLAGFADDRDPVEILRRLKDGWNSEDLPLLAKLTPQQFRDIFKANQGRGLARLISSSLSFSQIVNASDDMRKITAAARAGLGLIAAEAPINARRLRRYGIEPAHVAVEAAPAPAHAKARERAVKVRRRAAQKPEKP